MIEDGLFLGLGFCAATLIALACLPLLWSRALRLTRERLALLVPGSAAEIDAARDGLRAQAAVMQRRLEQRIEAADNVAAAIKTELGQRTVALVAVEKAAENLRSERSELLVDLADVSRALRDSEGQRFALEKTLHDADARVETAGIEARLAARRYDTLVQLAEERRGTIAALETRAAGLLAKLEDAREIAAERDARLRVRSEALAAAEVKMAERDEIIKRSQADLAALRQRIESLEAELRTRGHAPVADPPEASDALLRSAIIAVGDDALRLLRPAAEDQSSPPETAAVRIGERQP